MDKMMMGLSAGFLKNNEIVASRAHGTTFTQWFSWTKPEKIKKGFKTKDGLLNIAKASRYGGTYAHKDIAFEFASWISPQFKIYLITAFQRLKEEEKKQLGFE